jgi:hypothetical protein
VPTIHSPFVAIDPSITTGTGGTTVFVQGWSNGTSEWIDLGTASDLTITYTTPDPDYYDVLMGSDSVKHRQSYYTIASNNTNTPWAWGAPSATTGYQTLNWAVANTHYEAVRVTRVQSAMQEARGRAIAAGNHETPFNLESVAFGLSERLTDEQIALLRDTHRTQYLQANDIRLRAEASVARRNEVIRRAEVLLQSLLSAEQKREWLEFRYVTERAPSGRLWRLTDRVAAGVLLLNEAGTARRATLCVHPSGNLPIADVIATQLLHLRTNENSVITLANLHAGAWNEEERLLRQVASGQRMLVA